MIDETQRHPLLPCWLVWVMTTGGDVLLRAIDLVPEYADLHKAALTSEPNIQRVYVEESRLNHLYAGLLDARANVRRTATPSTVGRADSIDSGRDPHGAAAPRGAPREEP